MKSYGCIDGWRVVIAELLVAILLMLAILGFLGSNVESVGSVVWEIVKFAVSLVAAAGTVVALYSLRNEQRKRNRDDKYRTSDKVSVWVTELGLALAYDKGRVAICNSSEVPIFDVFVSIDVYGNRELLGKGDDRCVYIDVVPPGKYEVEAPFGGHSMETQFAASISFRDEKGVHWTRYANGWLEENPLTEGRDGGKRQVTNFEMRAVSQPVESMWMTDMD